MAKYLYSLFSSIPIDAYILLLSIFVLGALLICQFKNQSKGRYILLLFLIEYIAIIFMTTVVYRSTPLNGGIKLEPFWSYRVTGDNSSLMMENITNVLAFIPIGFLFGCCFNHISWKFVLLIGMALSMSVEFLQYRCDKGLCELDDVIHNTLGCVIGYGICRMINSVAKI